MRERPKSEDHPAAVAMSEMADSEQARVLLRRLACMRPATCGVLILLGHTGRSNQEWEEREINVFRGKGVELLAVPDAPNVTTVGDPARIRMMTSLSCCRRMTSLPSTAVGADTRVA